VRCSSVVARIHLPASTASLPLRVRDRVSAGTVCVIRDPTVSGCTDDSGEIVNLYVAQALKEAVSRTILRTKLATLVASRHDIADTAEALQFGTYAWCDSDFDQPTSVNCGYWQVPPALPKPSSDHCAACAMAGMHTHEQLVDAAAAAASALDEVLCTEGRNKSRQSIFSVLGLVPTALKSCDWTEASFQVHAPADRPVEEDSSARYCRVTATESFLSWQRVQFDRSSMPAGVVAADSMCGECWGGVCDGTLPFVPVIGVRDVGRGWDVLYAGSRSLLGAVEGTKGVWGGGPWMPLRNGRWLWQSASPALAALAT